MFMNRTRTSVRKVGAALLILATWMLTACGGATSSPSSATGGPLTGNWQVNLLQNFPKPQAQLSVSGFLVDSNNALTGSVQGPSIVSSNGSHACGGVGPLTGTVSGQNITFSLNPGGTIFTFTGLLSTDNTSMSGNYQALGGDCFPNDEATSGTWSAVLVPPLNGKFAGTLSNSVYMSLLSGANPPSPITVTGALAQSSNVGASNATLTGTITAQGYPCFTTASLSGTISGQNVYLDVFDYTGVQIGTLGVPGTGGIAGTPAVVASGSSGLTLSGVGQAGLSLGSEGTPPCPALAGNGTTVTTDVSDVAFTLQ